MINPMLCKRSPQEAVESMQVLAHSSAWEVVLNMRLEG